MIIIFNMLTLSTETSFALMLNQSGSLRALSTLLLVPVKTFRARNAQIGFITSEKGDVLAAGATAFLQLRNVFNDNSIQGDWVG